MADRISEGKQTLLKAMERAVEAGLRSQGVPLMAQTYPGSFTRRVNFSTGYAAGETVTPFMLDYSLLDGDDVLVD